MKIKKKYLFPLFYLAFLILSMIGGAKVDFILFLLLMVTLPTNLVYIVLSYVIDLPKDGTYFVLYGAILQFFIIGFLWDVIAEKIRNKKYWDRPI